ncbi:MAG TPA: tRNA pseudouridine(55) synthase TruB, partial [Polyangiaceae bacterium]|nr:tRNA pseudouridine(55) synthase TruB [Polyangiaceae bacterium]
MNGVLVVDKPAGMTSHDVVARVRRVLSERRVGHAGTLDPMATGVLVVMVGEATKLAPWLTRDDKRYRATVELGIATATLDAEGEVTARAPLPAWWTTDEAEARVAAALAVERARTEQLPPVFSAIKVAGRPAHARTRAGEEVTLAARRVVVHAIEVVARGSNTLELELLVSKG